MDRRNNFDAIRLIAAAAVIYGHAHPLTQQADPAFLGNAVHSFAVKVFFVISGYLICASWMADPNVGRYMHRRLLRILPALALTVLLTIVVLGPLTTSMGKMEYFSLAGTWRYLSNVAMYPIYDLPGVFVNNAYPVAVNGSLWSLPVEFAMYLVLPVVAVASSMARWRWVMLVVTAVFAMYALHFTRIMPPPEPVAFYGTNMQFALDVAPYFLFGACYFRFRDRIRPDPATALFLVGILLFLQPAGLYAEIALMLAAPYAILAFATANTPGLRSAGRYGDISYGLYLYGFPVQQALNHFSGNGLTAVQNALISLPIAAALAWMSWHALEKRALRLKPKARPMAGLLNEPEKKAA